MWLISEGYRNTAIYPSSSYFSLISAVIACSFPTSKLSATTRFVPPCSDCYLLVSLIKCLLPWRFNLFQTIVLLLAGKQALLQLWTPMRDHQIGMCWCCTCSLASWLRSEDHPQPAVRLPKCADCFILASPPMPQMFWSDAKWFLWDTLERP